MIHRIGRRQASVLAAVVSVCTVVALIMAHPAVAEPPGPNVPDAGARPPAAAAGATGTTPTQTVPAGLSPAAQQLQAETFAVQALAEQLKKLDDELAKAQSAVLALRNEMTDAERRVVDLREQAESAAADAYKASRALGPFGEYAGDLHRLSKVTPAIGARAGGPGAARELARAEAAARAAADAYRKAQTAESSALSRRDAVKVQYDQRAANLAALNANGAAGAEIDAYEASIGAGYDLGANADGLVPNPLVAKVLDHAQKQLGKPYKWGDEGPNSYDCSGLVWDSYRQVGKMLPRIANTQYRDTPKIADRNKLIAGDLVFFGPPGSWEGIHHVGIYMGGGKMIQAPTTGDVVKISTVWWSRYYGATRPLPAVNGPGTPPTSAPPSSSSSSNPSSTPPSSTPPSSTPPSSTPPSSTPPSSTPPSTSPSGTPSSSSSAPAQSSSATPSRSPSASSRTSSSSPAAAKPSSSSTSSRGSGSPGP
jgi:cell wall-associated NlpC family hydrolase